MRKLILASLFVGVLPISMCGPAGQPGMFDQGNRSANLAIETEKLPTGIVGSEYSAHLSATGGVPPYNWVVEGGTLPEGLALDGASGELRGTPTQFRKESLLLRVYDSTPGEKLESAAILLLEIIPDRLTIMTPALPQAIIGKSYTFKLEAAGGTEPYTWSIKEGSLPGGLELHPLSGVIQGEAVQGGTSVFSVQVTDSSTPPTSVAYRIAPLPTTDTIMR